MQCSGCQYQRSPQSSGSGPFLQTETKISDAGVSKHVAPRHLSYESQLYWKREHVKQDSGIVFHHHWLQGPGVASVCD